MPGPFKMKKCSGIERQLKATTKRPEQQVQVLHEEPSLYVVAGFSLANEELVSHWNAGWDEKANHHMIDPRHLLTALDSQLSKDFCRSHL